MIRRHPTLFSLVKMQENAIRSAWDRSGTLPGLILLAIIYTVLNGIKPLHIDDTAYFYYAAQMAEHPLDPYGFEIFWYQFPEPAQKILAPPVLPYWWSCAIRLFGDRMVCWKLWMFPFGLLFVLALHGLFQRFASGLEGPLVWMTVLSPIFLPSLNLMLDVPSLALRLSGVLIFLLACDRDSPRLAMAAGFVGALAVETKYTGVLGPATMLLYATFARKVSLGLIACACAGVVIVAWELWVAAHYGQSHFLYHLHAYKPIHSADEMVETLLGMLGGLAPSVTLLGLAALRLPGMIVLAAAVVLTVPYLLLIGGQGDGLNPAQIFAIFGFIQYAILLAIIWCLWMVDTGRSTSTPSPKVRRQAVGFLILWTILEILGYFILTPFLAVRRVMGVVVLVTMLAGSLAARTCRPTARMILIRCIAVSGIILGLLYYGVDLLEASAHREAAERAAAWIRSNGGGTAWFVGHWGFQFYAERAGMRPAVSGISRLREGDWLVVPSWPVDQQSVRLDFRAIRLAETISIGDAVPLRTVPGYYACRSPTFLEHHCGPRVSVHLYQVLADFMP